MSSTSSDMGGRCGLTQEKLDAKLWVTEEGRCKALCKDGSTCGDPYSKHEREASITTDFQSKVFERFHQRLDADKQEILKALNKRESENVTMSGLSGGMWSKLCSQIGVAADDVTVNLVVPHNRYVNVPNEFKWDIRTENQQNDEYISYIKLFITLSSQICLLDIHASKQFLSIHTPRINVTGTTDIIIALKDQFEKQMTDLPPRVLAAHSLVVIELKKEKITEQARTQAKAELLAADLTGMLCRPICLLSNLQDYYELFWIFELNIYASRLEAGAAFAVINAVLQEFTDDKLVRLGQLDIFKRDKIRSHVKLLPGIKEQTEEQTPPKKQKTHHKDNDDDDEEEEESRLHSHSHSHSHIIDDPTDDIDEGGTLTWVRRLPGEEGGLEEHMSPEDVDYYWNRFSRRLLRQTFPSLFPRHVQATMQHVTQKNHNTSIPFLSPPSVV